VRESNEMLKMLSFGANTRTETFAPSSTVSSMVLCPSRWLCL